MATSSSLSRERSRSPHQSLAGSSSSLVLGNQNTSGYQGSSKTYMFSGNWVKDSDRKSAHSFLRCVFALQSPSRLLLDWDLESCETAWWHLATTYHWGRVTKRVAPWCIEEPTPWSGNASKVLRWLKTDLVIELGSLPYLHSCFFTMTNLTPLMFRATQEHDCSVEQINKIKRFKK